MALSLDDIARLFEAKGGRLYSGEPVTQLEHALQSALLAESAGASDALITAALLHDLGHLINDLGETPTLRGIDDKHQYVALPFLRGLFGDDVLQPIKLHVDAKRYLCVHGDGTLSGAEYWAALSDDSKRSLELQGGVFGAAEADAFIAQPYAADAVKLRRWDDLAKTAGAATPPLSHYLARAARAARS
ncbi:MAG: HD domain-containing protein [Burkholderiaceae bacterium]|nr:HD domain-containing protein [Burkholderiaceae bacterium]